MKKQWIVAVALFATVISQAQPLSMPEPGRPGAPGMPGMPPAAAAAPAEDPVNYQIHVEWTDSKGESRSLDVLTTEGNFDLSTIQKTSVKINNADIPTTLKFNGSIRPLTGDHARLQLFLGRTVPYVTGTSGGLSSTQSYSQMSVGLQSTFIVKFDKPLVVQTDENGRISVVVKRLAD
jgi:hypothetical protein